MTSWERAGVAATVIALAGSGLWMGRVAPAPDGPVDPLGAAPYRVCPVAEAGGGFSSRLGLYRDGDAGGRLSAVGGPQLAQTFQFSDSFAYQTDVGGLAELGLTPLLVESDAAGGVYNRAGGASAVAGCISATADPVAVLGMATSGGETSILILTNPFAVEASVQLEAVSEFGIDTPTDLEQVRIPAATSLELDFNQTLAGRETLSFAITPLSGSVVAGMKRAGESDVAASEAIAGSTEWFFALPDFGVDFGIEGAIHLRALVEGDTAFRIDRIGTDVLAEAVAEGTITPQAEATFGLADLGAEGGGFVLSSDQPVAAAIVYAGAESLAVSAGADTAATSWAVPVSSLRAEGRTAVWLLNTTDRNLTGTVMSLNRETKRIIALPAGATTGMLLDDLGGSGALVTADGPIAAFYGVLSGSAVGMSAATPLE